MRNTRLLGEPSMLNEGLYLLDEGDGDEEEEEEDGLLGSV